MENEAAAGALLAMSGFSILLGVVVAVITIASMWVLYTKAGEPGYAAIIPIYNIIVYLKIANKEWYWIFLLCIPFVNIICGIIVMYDFLKAFGKGNIVSFLLAFFFQPIYFAYLAFSKDVQYVG